MKHLVGKKITKKVEFMDDTVEIKKLSVVEVRKVQEIVKKNEKNKSEEAQLKLLQDVIKLAVPEAEDLTDDDFNTFPIGELAKLTDEIMVFSGLAGAQAEGN
jgi:hypothetical protein